MRSPFDRYGGWRKLGRIFRPASDGAWMSSHASNPIAEPLADTRVRIYFGARDAGNRSSIGSFEIDLREPDRIQNVSSRPLVAPGETGAFDDSGASPGCLVRVGDRRFLYYVGWNLGVTVPWRNAIGLAIAEDDGLAFRKVSRAPVMDRADTDPYSLSYPWVMIDEGEWRMWYGSNLVGGATVAEMQHVIKEARSADGLSWHRDGAVRIGLGEGGDIGVARPCVIRDADRYRMWYARRGKAYDLGYGESVDGVTWERLDGAVGIARSKTGWDSEMLTYPCVFDHAGERWMLYNGNGYGSTGIGLAVLEQ